MANFQLEYKRNSDLSPGPIIDAAIKITISASMSRVINFSATPVAFKPNQITIIAGMKKIILPSVGGILKNSARIDPLPAVYAINAPIELTVTDKNINH